MMKRQYNIILFGIIMIIAVIFSSCNMEYLEFDKMSKDNKLNTRYAGPIVHGRVNIGDILNRFDDDDDVQAYDNGLLYLVYKSTTYSRRMDEVIILPDQSYTENFVETDTDMPTEPYAATETITRERYFVMAFNNDEKLDSILLDAGSLDINVNNTFVNHDATLTVSSSNIILGTGQTLNKKIDINSGGSVDPPVQLDISTLTFDHFNTSSAVSYIPVTFTLELSGSSNTGATLDESVDIDMDIKNLDYNALYGSLGSQSMLDSNDNIEVQIFDDYPLSGMIEYGDPKFFIHTKNSVGATVDLDISNITTSEGTNMEFSSDVNPFPINGPSFNEIGQQKDTSFYIDENNCSNIVEAMREQPTSILYNATANLPSSGSKNNFALDSSRLSIGVAVELPLNVWTNEIVLQDTGDFNLGEIFDTINAITIRKVLVRIENINGLPADIRAQVVLVDSNYNEVDSLFSGKKDMLVTKAAKVDTNGYVVEPTKNVVDIEIDDIDRLKRWGDVKYTLSRIYCTTAETGNKDHPWVKFHVDDEVIIKVGLDAHLTIE